MKVALVSCGKEKREGIHAAEDLYTSPRFKLAWKYASRHFIATYILSARYGLLKPTTPIQSYYMTLADMPADERGLWAEKTVQQIRYHIMDGAHLHFLCPQQYAGPLVSLVR